MGGRAVRDEHRDWRLRAVRALTESIAHWERLRDGTQGPNEYTDSGSCACCVQWPETECGGCPIRERTGEGFCLSTPYHDAANEHFDHGSNPGVPRPYAQAMIDFLTETRRLVKLRKVNPSAL